MTAPFNRIIVGDFETYWCRKTGYTLSKMSNEAYIRDPRFRAHGMAYKYYGEPGPARWVSHDQLPSFFRNIFWQDVAFCAHHAHFDAAILSWHYDVRPVFIFDTLSMARALRGVEAGNSIEKLARAFGLPPKGKELESTDGVNILTIEQEQALIPYAQHDVMLAESVLARMLEGYPTKELALIDMTVRMFTEPVLELDKEMLLGAIGEELAQRTALLDRIGVAEKELASNDKFAEILRGLGVEPPTKKGKPAKDGTPRKIYAFAKNDAHFQALQHGEREDVALLCEARLAVKSTQARTRAHKFLDIATRGTLPVPLNYYGAHTGRWAATQGINLQNLKRGSFLRKAMMAPEGYVIVVADLSQIEPRVLAWLAGYQELLDIFASGADAYAAFGAQMFGIPGMTKESHPQLRQSAKSALLGAGYGLGWLSFAAQLLVGFLGAPPIRYDKAFAKQLGITGDQVARFMSWETNVERALSIPRTCTDAEIIVHCVVAKEIIDRYREAAAAVASRDFGFWQLCDTMIEKALFGGKEFTHKCLTFRHEEILLPNGMSLRYPDLSGDYDERGRIQWSYGPANNRKKLYGGKVTENIVQAVARIVMTDGMLRIHNAGVPVRLTAHDEAGTVAPEGLGKHAYDFMIEQMTKEPRYMPGIPLAASGGWARRYGDAKE